MPTPALLLETTSQDGHIYVLIYERIMHSENLYDAWQELKSEESKILPLLKSVIVEIATQHVLGIVQHDLHLQNFLITEKKIYTLDGAQIEKQDDLLSREESIENLSLFLSQLGMGFEQIQEKLFDHYARSRGWLTKPVDWKKIKDGIAKEIENRTLLRHQLNEAGIKNVLVTEILESNTDDNWSLAKYEEFQTLLELYKKDRVEFQRVVHEWYGTALIPLLERLSANTEFPGDYSLDDIGYQDGTFFLYDIEKNKSLLKVVVDVYGKLIHWYAKQKKAGDEDGAKLLSQLIDEVRELQRAHSTVAEFNEALKERLESPVLQDALAGRESEIFQRFRL